MINATECMPLRRDLSYNENQPLATVFPILHKFIHRIISKKTLSFALDFQQNNYIW
jgi:hypothetical protein